MNLSQVNNLIVNRKSFTYSIKFGDVSALGGSIYKVYDWLPNLDNTPLKDVMAHYADVFSQQTAVVRGELIEDYYIVSVGHMEMLNNIKIKSHDESKRA